MATLYDIVSDARRDARELSGRSTIAHVTLEAPLYDAEGTVSSIEVRTDFHPRKQDPQRVSVYVKDGESGRPMTGEELRSVADHVEKPSTLYLRSYEEDMGSGRHEHLSMLILAKGPLQAAGMKTFGDPGDGRGSDYDEIAGRFGLRLDTDGQACRRRIGRIPQEELPAAMEYLTGKGLSTIGTLHNKKGTNAAMSVIFVAEDAYQVEPTTLNHFMLEEKVPKKQRRPGTLPRSRVEGLVSRAAHYRGVSLTDAAYELTHVEAFRDDFLPPFY